MVEMYCTPMNWTTSTISRLAFLLVVGAMAGCASMQSTGRVTIENDEYSETAKVTTIDHTVTSGSDVLLRGFVPKDPVDSSEVAEGDSTRLDSLATELMTSLTGKVRHQIYFEMYADDWHYWDELRYLSDGSTETIDLDDIASDVNCTAGTCTHTEDVAADVSRAELKTMAGDSIRVYSGQYSNHWETIFLSEKEVNDYLAAVDSLESRFHTE